MLLYVDSALQAEVVQTPYSNATRISTGDQCLAFGADDHRVELFVDFSVTESLPVDGKDVQTAVTQVRCKQAIHVKCKLFHPYSISSTRRANLVGRCIDVKGTDKTPRPHVVNAYRAIFRATDDNVQFGAYRQAAHWRDMAQQYVTDRTPVLFGPFCAKR